MPNIILRDLILALTSIPSVTGDERAVLEAIEKLLTEHGLKVERIPVEDNRWNIYVAVGTPKVILTTHVDVVPAAAELFRPRIENGKIFARGSCDAKGIAACMIAAFQQLLSAGHRDIGLLFVVGEETDGIGSKVAAAALKERGIRYLINGEPTEGGLALGHKGCISYELRFPGMSCHSGYPELGIDANLMALRACQSILDIDLGVHPVLGPGTVNIGTINGGSASNVIAGECVVTGTVRTVSPVGAVLEKIKAVLPEDAQILCHLLNDPVKLKTLDGFKTYVAAYGTDIPNFADLGAECLLFGPGSINVAHTTEEHLDLAEAESAVADYVRMVTLLSS